MIKLRKTKNIGINAILNVINQGMRIVFPLITYPYAIRILGADGIGKVNFSNSIVSYFSLVAMLGVSTYAVREGAKRRENRNALQDFSNEVFTINVITTAIAYAGLLIALLFVPKLQDYSGLILLQSLSIAFTTLGIDWINTIHEDFYIITLRSVFTNVLTLILLFVLVRTVDDYYNYALLTVISNGVICISNWFYCRRYVKIRLTRKLELRKHIQPLFVLFANTIAISIYVNLDITMLGWFKGDYEVGVYSVAVKVYSIIKSMLAAIYAVAIPRLAAYIGSKNEDGYRTTNTNLWCYLSIILIPSSVGLICLSSDIMRFMGGADFANHGLVLQILGVALVFAIFGGLVTACLNVTLGREKDNLLATIIAALLNCGLNLFMIPMFAQNGAAITTLIAEAFVLIFCTARVPSISTYLDKKEVIKEILHSLIGSIAIVIIASSLKMIIGNYVARIACIIVASVVIYFVVLLFLKDRYTKEIMINIKHRIFK